MRSLSSKWMCAFACVLGVLTAYARAQTAAAVQQIATDDGKQQLVPSRNVEFKAVETDPTFSLPSSSIEYPHCLSDGSLVLRTVDWQAVNRTPKGQFPKYNDSVILVRGKKMQTILSTSISDLTDINFILDVFPADSGIYFLLQATKDPRGERGPHKSPAGIPFASYRYYVARFDLDGTYREATELSVGCDPSQSGHCEPRHLAVFPSGDMLVTESDPGSSTLKVLYLKSSGEVVKQIDVPAGRKPLDWGDSSSNSEIQEAARTFLASVFFTAVGDNIVVWRANSNDPVVEVRQGGGVREVPIQVPDRWRFADMVASNDRWVVHFRTENTPPSVRMSTDIDAYYDVRPQDGSLAARLVQKGDIPLSIACESSGTYTSFKINDGGKTVLLAGN